MLPTRKSGWMVGFGLALVLLTAGWFASTASYARRESVTGWLTPELGIVRSTASRGGLVRALHISEQDEVKAGDPLARLRLRDGTHSGNYSATQIDSLDSHLRALREQHTASDRQLDLDSGRLTTRLQSLKSERQDVEAQLAFQRSRVSMAQKDLDRAEKLHSEGHIAVVDRQRAEAISISARQYLASLTRSSKSLSREIEDVSAQVSAIPVARALMDAEMDVKRATVQERMARIKLDNEYVVSAPVDGVVAVLPVRVGESVNPGFTIAIIAPIGKRLAAEMYVPSRAAGFIAKGQPLTLKYDAFPFQRFGTQLATVKDVSSVVLRPIETKIPGLEPEEPVFRVRADLPDQHLEAYAMTYPLRPGMLVRADLITDQRTLIEWLFDPIFAVGRR